ncbi:hypothetical protein VME0621_05077 [Vibrio mediterranei]|uniref:hypothetical protein n=1 Tax=Vibrio mediterranei TaxID=689 RepID=UPI0007840910|nr:hypothetical protein [Vibrio mediterranei]SBO12906.1 hypothetical protein VME0621_05077 [Vibrio mediterranei]
MAFFILLFLAVGFIVGLATPENRKSHAYSIYILVSIGWAFAWGPFAILTFLELAGGDWLARKIKSPFTKPASSSNTDLKVASQDKPRKQTSVRAQIEDHPKVVSNVHSDKLTIELSSLTKNTDALEKSYSTLLKVHSLVPTKLPNSRKIFGDLVAVWSVQLKMLETIVQFFSHDVFKQTATREMVEHIIKIKQKSIASNEALKPMFEDPVNSLLEGICISKQVEAYKHTQHLSYFNAIQYCFREHGDFIEETTTNHFNELQEMAKKPLKQSEKLYRELKDIAEKIDDSFLNSKANQLALSVARAKNQIDTAPITQAPRQLEQQNEIRHSKKQALSILDQKISASRNDKLVDQPNNVTSIVSEPKKLATSPTAQIELRTASGSKENSVIFEIYDNFTKANLSAKAHAKNGQPVKVTTLGEYRIVSSSELSFDLSPNEAKYFYQMISEGLTTQEIANKNNTKHSSSIAIAASLVKQNILALADVKHQFNISSLEQEIAKRAFEQQFRQSGTIRLKPFYETHVFKIPNINYNDLTLLAAEVQRRES